MTGKQGVLHIIIRHKKRLREALLLLMAAVFLIGGGGVIWLSSIQMPDVTGFIQRKVAQSTKIFDRTGKILLYDIHEDTKRTIIPFEEISQYIKDGAVAIEDTEFYSHRGIKPLAIVRAVIADLIPGGLTQGGSTITQQVIKNSILTKDKTPTRKLKEWILALKLERILSKDQILYTYLNENPYGGSIYGVEEASRQFFGKSAKDVTLAEAAYIAAIPQAPTFYSPYGKNKDRLDARQRLVLRKMVEHDFITQEEYDAALKEVVSFKERNSANIRAPHFALYVRDYLIEKYGEETVERDGLIVTTTLDFAIQEKIEKVVAGYAKSLEEDFGASNTASVAIDPKTGDILAMIGSRDYFEKENQGNFNVTLAHRQPGSAFKPFVYATAWDEGYTPATVLFDVKTEFSSECAPDGTPKSATARCYSPENYDSLFEGPESMKTALAHSRNIPAVKTLYLAGIKDSIETAENMGITSLTTPDRYGLTLVLGGGEVSLLELTSAYGVFANDGMRNPYRSILLVKDADGNILEEANLNPVRALKENTARQINDALSDTKVRLESLNALINPMRRDVAVKTGTTNDYRDVWIIGYTPNLVIGSWAGRNDNSPMEKKVAGLVIAPVWAAQMNEAVAELPKERFKDPEPIPLTIKPVLRGIWKGGQSYFIDTTSGKVATDFTPAEVKEEVIFNSVHNILHWVDKEDPTGPIPSRPERDSQYVNWEYGVRKWFGDWKSGNPSFQESSSIVIPVERDDVHVPENFPQVTITSPSANARFDEDDELTVTAEAEGKYEMKKADFFLNNVYVGSDEKAPFSFTFVPDDVSGSRGEAELRVVIYDTVYNKGESTLRLEFSE